MDQFGNYYQNTNINYSNGTNNRVYINRNFNRMGPPVVPSTLPNTNVMYFNPNFSQYNYVQHRDQTIRPKIHVNPNFIKAQTLDLSTDKIPQINTVSNTSGANNICHQLHSTRQTQPAIQQNKPSEIRNVSRYCLTRQVANNVATSHQTIVPKNNTQQTVKISKYKSVSLNTVKENLAREKSSSHIKQNPIQSNLLKSKSKFKITPSDVKNARYKFIKRNYVPKLTSDTKLSTTVKRTLATPTKSVLKISFKQRKKVIRGMMKKNNIPCPLYKKYGKCLRMIQGSCDFLHDKKHVSICRKFLAGVCHDKQCLLSHDLTDKKMPTCYFFLQGICTKEACPYLHVKLNVKTKICTDFLKGYCEKGDKCLHRHVNNISQSNTKLNKTKKQSCYKLINKKTDCSETNIQKGNITPVTVVSEIVNDMDTKDQRYFIDIADDATSEKQFNIIKPIRCKLGTLPSFIQL